MEDIQPLHLREPGEPLTCDFCNAAAVKLLDIPDFIMGHGIRSTSGWAVCEVCMALVEDEDVTGLFNRAKRSIANRSLAASRFVAEGELEKLHGRFWHAYHRQKLAAATAAANAFVSSVTKYATPPWIAAYEAQFDALKTLESMSVLMRGTKLHGTANDARDINALKIAEAYSFSGNALEAIKQLSQKVPHDSPLHPSQVPGIGQGWWWFEPPLDIETNTFSKNVHALLWGFIHPRFREWTELRDKYQRSENTFMIPAGSPIEDVEKILTDDASVASNAYLMFTAFTYSDLQGKRTLLPSTSFRWFMNETVHEMMVRNAVEYRTAYGPGGQFDGDTNTMGETHHLGVVNQLALFYLASCVWLAQDYLEVEHKPIERHRRKAFAREHKLDKPPATVRVIALRKRRVTDSDDPAKPGEKTGGRLTVQFICSGHLRNQPYGPGRTMRKLVYIEAYPKGPKDAPFKSPVKKVYAVIR
jgi:hypothetical protein